jgi:hypothetical protein
MNKSKAILTFSLLTLLILLIATAAFAAVEVNYFKVQSWEDDVVTVEWETATQNDIVGFYVWRSDKNLPVTNGDIDTTQATLLNENAIIIEDTNGVSHSCASSGGLYEFEDTTISSAQDTYWYYIEAQKCLSTTREFYDEVLSYEGNQPGGLEATRPTIIEPESGGELTSPNGMVQLNFPPGAVISKTTIIYTEQLTPSTGTGNLLFAGTSFDISAIDANGDPVTNFSKHFTMTVSYTDTDWLNAGISDENQLNIYWLDGSDWVGLRSCAGCLHEPAANRFIIILDHLSEFALLGRQGTQIYLPILQK